MEQIRERLKLTPLMIRLEDAELDMLLKVAQKMEYRSGELIVREGEPGDSLFIILEGAVNIVKKGQVQNVNLVTLRKDECFGEIFLVDVSLRSATVIAAEDATLLRFTAEDIASICREDSKILSLMVTNIARILSRRLRGANERIVELIEKEG